jgi:hypothetical protein
MHARAAIVIGAVAIALSVASGVALSEQVASCDP